MFYIKHTLGEYCMTTMARWQDINGRLTFNDFVRPPPSIQEDAHDSVVMF